MTAIAAALPGGMVDVQTHDRDIVVDAQYATKDNFTGAKLPGYCGNRLLLKRDAARRLARAQKRLERGGEKLRVLDAYRPARASRAMVRWAERTGREHLLNGFIARRSNHARGTTVDLTIDGADMGSAYDSFSGRSITRNASGRALRNRLRLVRAMETEGFRNYSKEWWHFDTPGSNAPRLDAPIPCSD